MHQSCIVLFIVVQQASYSIYPECQLAMYMYLWLQTTHCRIASWQPRQPPIQWLSSTANWMLYPLKLHSQGLLKDLEEYMGTCTCVCTRSIDYWRSTCAYIRTHTCSIAYRRSTCVCTHSIGLRVTISGHGNSANFPVNNFGVDAYTTTNSDGAPPRKDS